MPAESPSEASQRFARDLRRIREDREVSIAEVSDATQIDETQLEAFEGGALFGKSTMNPVYLRALVRAYAEAVGISPEDAATQFEGAGEGDYDNQLAVQYLDVPPAVVDRESEERSEEEGSEAEPPGSAPGEEGSDTGDHSKSPTEGPRAPDAQGRASEHASLENQSSESEEPEGPASLSASESAPKTSHSGDSSSEPAPPSSAEGADHSFSWTSRRTLLLTGIGLLGLLIVGLGIGLLTFKEPSSAEEPGDQANAPPKTQSSPSESSPDTSASSTHTRPPATLTLGDTLHVTVLATSGIQEMRVQQDEDLRRPYWVEEGEATVFPFTRRITLENELDEARLFLEGYSYPATRTDTLGRVVIDRQTAQSFADTLRGSPEALSTDPDTAVLRRSPPTEPGGN